MTVGSIDVDSIVLPIDSASLFSFPSYLTVELLSSPMQCVKDVSGAVCIGKMGYRIYAYIDERSKIELCARITVAGVTLIPHSCPTILCTGTSTGTITIGLQTLARCIIQCQINVLYLVGYGMKAPYTDYMYLIRIRPPSVITQCSCRYDLGRQVMVPYIPLFGIEDGIQGTVYGMLNLQDGSVSLNIECEEENVQGITLKVYPRIIHYLKAMGLNQEMPQTIRGMRTRLGQLQTLLVSLDSIHTSILCGFRFEFVMYAKASINQCHELIHDFPMTDGVPDGVVIKQQIDIEDYITQLRNTVADAIAAGFNVWEL